MQSFRKKLSEQEGMSDLEVECVLAGSTVGVRVGKLDIKEDSFDSGISGITTLLTSSFVILSYGAICSTTLIGSGIISSTIGGIVIMEGDTGSGWGIIASLLGGVVLITGEVVVAFVGLVKLNGILDSKESVPNISFTSKSQSIIGYIAFDFGRALLFNVEAVVNQ